MKLKTKLTLPIVVIMFLQGLAFIALYQFYIVPNVLSFEEKSVKTNLERAIQALGSEHSELKLLVYDWGAWDDTYEYMQDKNSDYEQSNLGNEVFSGSDLNILYYVDTNLNVVWGKAYDNESNFEIQLPSLINQLNSHAPAMLRLKEGDEATSGYLMTGRGPVILAFSPILNSEFEGPVRGTLIMGRFISNALLEKLIKKTRSDIRLWPLGSESIPSSKNIILNKFDDKTTFITESIGNQLSTYSTIDDLSGKNSLLLAATIERKSHALFQFAMEFYAIGVTIVTLSLLVVIISVIIYHSIYKDLNKIFHYMSKVESNPNHEEILILERKDELEHLSRILNRMLIRLRSHQMTAKRQASEQGAIEMRKKVLTHTKQCITPISQTIKQIKHEIKSLPTNELTRIASELPISTDEKKIILTHELEALVNRYKILQNKIYHDISDVGDKSEQVTTKVESLSLRGNFDN